MSKRKDKSPASKAGSTASVSAATRQAKLSRPALSLDAELAEVEKLEKPEEIEAKAKKLRDDLVNEWNKGKEHRDIQSIEIQMAVAKVLLTKLRYLPLTHTPGGNAKDLVIARDILEVGVWFSIAKCEKNVCNPEALKEFERYFSQLKHYYFDMRGILKDSAHMYEILGMNLLNLLSQYRIADFHRELELFIHPNVDAVLENPYIKKAVEIEQYIMEGQYNKIYALKGAKADDLKKSGLTSAGFKYFIDHLENTLKEHTSEIADVIGTAYDRLSMQAAMQLLNLKESSKMADIIKKQNWQVKEGYVYFHTKKDANDIIPAEQLMKNALSYADELETIV